MDDAVQRKGRRSFLVPLAMSLIVLSPAVVRVWDATRLVDLLALLVGGMLLGIFLVNGRHYLRSERV